VYQWEWASARLLQLPSAIRSKSGLATVCRLSSLSVLVKGQVSGWMKMWPKATEKG